MIMMTEILLKSVERFPNLSLNLVQFIQLLISVEFSLTKVAFLLIAYVGRVGTIKAQNYLSRLAARIGPLRGTHHAFPD